MKRQAIQVAQCTHLLGHHYNGLVPAVSLCGEAEGIVVPERLVGILHPLQAGMSMLAWQCVLSRLDRLWCPQLGLVGRSGREQVLMPWELPAGVILPGWFFLGDSREDLPPEEELPCYVEHDRHRGEGNHWSGSLRQYREFLDYLAHLSRDVPLSSARPFVANCARADIVQDVQAIIAVFRQAVSMGVQAVVSE